MDQLIKAYTQVAKIQAKQELDRVIGQAQNNLYSMLMPRSNDIGSLLTAAYVAKNYNELNKSLNDAYKSIIQSLDNL
ncbi:MAG TPA: hypothetical protein PLK90_01975 [Clostridiales bacterium]|nr:hypothetical protein [Clostridiales bacterium]HQP69144.1 hypothetical protein [Clostridiales bacterium]